MFLYSKTTQSQIINESYSSSHMCRCTSIIGNSLVRKSIAEIYGLSPIWNGQLSQERVCWWLIYLQKEETKKDWSLFSNNGEVDADDYNDGNDVSEDNCNDDEDGWYKCN